VTTRLNPAWSQCTRVNAYNEKLAVSRGPRKAVTQSVQKFSVKITDTEVRQGYSYEDKDKKAQPETQMRRNPPNANQVRELSFGHSGVYLLIGTQAITLPLCLKFQVMKEHSEHEGKKLPSPLVRSCTKHTNPPDDGGQQEFFHILYHSL